MYLPMIAMVVIEMSTNHVTKGTLATEFVLTEESKLELIIEL